jgi:glycosyltransferase involved in cell wall biosynthesis
MTKKLKVLHIINNLEIGGAEKILITLLKELSKRKDLELYVVSLEGHGDLIKDIPKNVEVKEFNYKLFSSSVKSRLDLFFRSKLFEYVAEIDPDVIHGHLIKGEDFAKVLGGLLRKPVIITSHDSLIHPGRKVKFLKSIYYKRRSSIRRVAKHLNEIYDLSSDKIQVIPNTIDVGEFAKGKKRFIPRSPFLFI